MLEFLKKNIFIIILSIITLLIGFLTFLTFLDRSFIELNQSNLQYLLILNIFLLILLFGFIFIEIKIDGIKVNNEKYVIYFLLDVRPSLSISFLIDIFI